MVSKRVLSKSQLGWQASSKEESLPRMCFASLGHCLERSWAQAVDMSHMTSIAPNIASVQNRTPTASSWR
eukprot:5685022-Amphidinium_carterae.1